MAGSHPDYVHFGYAYEAWLAADASDTISRAERDCTPAPHERGLNLFDLTEALANLRAA